MAATACAYSYQAGGPAQVRLPDTFIDDVDGAVQKAEQTPAPAPPPPPLPRPSKVPPSSFLSHHLDICTEGLGSESSGDIDLSDLTDDVNGNDNDHDAACVDVGQALPCKWQHRDGGGDAEPGSARSARPAFPPPISLIGAGGQPWLYLRPQREDGRLVLREVRIPSRELLQARREDGRFKLQFAQPQPDDEKDECQLAQGQDPAEAMAPEKTQQGNEKD
ncbi:protein FAF-like, chloroplastic [Miscanthus floridulus]|uniref:protein FAF-like, chloroplastic n=1 Tax=Miscanthus floridulus TaxID=154761 RepID=UPI003457AAA4